MAVATVPDRPATKKVRGPPARPEDEAFPQAPLPTHVHLDQGPTIGQDSGALPHMRQLDGLRALAVWLVLWHHWMPRVYTRGIHLGAWGVDLFFVLSGFLITGILLQCRRHCEEGGQGVLFTARRFYVRRFLRIFPLYYGALFFVTVALSIEPKILVSLWTYTFNLYAGFRGEVSGTLVAHFWSLAVEEQFYLVWPWVVLLVPRRRLAAVIGATIAIGPLSRLALLASGAPSDAVRMATFSCLDTLASGALLAHLLERRGPQALHGGWLSRVCLGLGIPLACASLALQWNRPAGVPEPTGTVLLVSLRWPILCWLVAGAARGFRGPGGRLLASSPLAYLGQISYGLYVFHDFALLPERAGLPLRSLHPLVRFVAYGLLTIAIASLSWHLYEGRINALKSRFPYRRRSHERALEPAPGSERGRAA